ncbi:MAG: hypothetical protein JKX95_06180 [Bacteroidia bacterium]|nr:hypothetical protein [Bacteroidia bacterium]
MMRIHESLKIRFYEIRMHKYIILIFSILISISTLKAENKVWSDGTAFTLPKKRYEIGLFQPLRYGITENTELITYPIWSLLFPNITIKKVWEDPCCFRFATRHSINYPTQFLKTISRSGIGGILPVLTKVPQLFVFTNHLLFSKAMTDEHVVSTKLGFTVVLSSGEMDMTTIDLPVVFPRTFVYQNGLSFSLGIDFDGQLYKSFNYTIDADFFILGDDITSYAFEHKAMLTWIRSERFNLLLGYKFIYGEYPYGTDINILPLLDIQFGRNRGVKE